LNEAAERQLGVDSITDVVCSLARLAVKA
jgi:hypothetical protein